MKVLGLDTSSSCLSLALVEEGRLTCLAARDDGLKHSVNFMPMLDGMLASRGIAPHDIDLIAVTSGPGSFTGLRIGVSAVKGLAFAGDKPCAGVSTLKALAVAAGVQSNCDLLCAVMDARRGEVYNAIFDGHTGERLSDDRAIKAEELGLEVKKRGNVGVLLVGDGAELCAGVFAENGVGFAVAPPSVRMAVACGAAFEGLRMHENGQSGSADGLAINYLRLSQAERERKERSSHSQETEGTHV